jgi:hypothetical protein
VLAGYDGSSTVGQSPVGESYQGVYDRIASPYRPATVSTTPAHGPLGGQFPEEPRSEIGPFREFDEPMKRETPDVFRNLPAWHIGTSVPDTAACRFRAAPHGTTKVFV